MHCGIAIRPMSALGHVWTAPPWQELSDVFAALVGCGHVSGLLMRRGWPLALMLCADRVPIVSTHFKSAMTQTGSPDPRIDLVCITSSCPRQFLQNFGTPSSLPGLTSLNRSGFDATTLWHFEAAERAPSTASLGPKRSKPHDRVCPLGPRKRTNR